MDEILLPPQIENKIKIYYRCAQNKIAYPVVKLGA